MTTPSNTRSAALQTRSGTSRIELQAESWSGQIRREPISVWALLKDALNTRNHAAAQPDESFITTRPAPLLAMPVQQDEVQMDRRSAAPQEQEAEESQPSRGKCERHAVGEQPQQEDRQTWGDKRE